MKKLILIITLILLSVPSFSKGSCGKYYITGKAFDSNHKILADKILTVTFKGEKTEIRTDKSGNYKITVTWLVPCPSGLSEDEFQKEYERQNPPWISVNYMETNYMIENQWKNYIKMGVSNEAEVTRHLDLQF
ncbi:MAG: hypothetical protein ACJ75J_08835 [Cytophagaceae bacterium]